MDYFQLSCHLCLISSALGFNLDTRFPLMIHGPPGSHFGYSVAFHRNREGTWALVGAPRGDSEVYNYPVERPGLMYKCTLKGICTELAVDRTGPEEKKDHFNVRYQDNRDRMWLGSCVGEQRNPPHRVMVCGPRWKNSRFGDSLFINGVCYLLDEDLHETSSQKLLPLIGTIDQQQNANQGYRYALGLAGTSFTFTEDSNYLLLGAPGLFSWRGSVILYDFLRGSISNPRVLLNSNKDVGPDAYYGYSVASGRFLEDQEVRFAVGAPRDNEYMGAVYFIREERGSQSSQFRLVGTTLGSYFGSSMASVNLTRGRYSSLLVGAPFYSTDTGGDEGQVHVYISNGKVLREQNVMVVGDLVPGARFGTAISEVGDVNQDSFIDVAVGAPYQDNGHGAVYIYHGGPAGLRCLPAPQICKPAQVIPPSTKNWAVRGFGTSLGLPMDVDDNGTPDIIIGSYASDQLAIIRTSPVIGISLSLSTSVDGLDRNGNSTTKGFCSFNGKDAFCFDVKACVLITGTRNVSAVFTAILEMDPSDPNQVRQTRRYYLDDFPENRLTKNLTLNSDDKSCFQVNVKMPYEDTEGQDYETPVLIKLEAILNPPSETEFCKECPVLNPENVTSIFREIPFITGCSQENKCVPDLDVEAAIIGMREGDILVSGANRTLTLEVRVESRRDPAYQASLSVSLPDGVNVVNQANCHIRGSQSEARDISLQCRLGDPFKRTQTKEYRFVLDIRKLPITQQETKIVIKAASKDMEDDERTIYLYFQTEASIKLTGEAEKASYFYGMDDKRLPFVHRYNVETIGPSPMEDVKLQIRLPVRNQQTGQRFLNIKSLQVFGLNSDSSIRSFCNVSGENELPNTTLSRTGDEGDGTNFDVPDGDVPLIVERRGDIPNDLDLREFTPRPRTDDGTSFYEINCETADCETIVCFLGPFPGHRQVVLVVIPAEVDLEAIKGIGGGAENVTLVSYGKAEALDTLLFPDAVDSTQVFIQLVQFTKPRALPVASWIIAVSTGGGFLLLCLLILGLVQLGFFHRKKHEELKKLMNDGQVANPSMDNDVVLEEDQEDHELPDMTENPFPDVEND